MKVQIEQTTRGHRWDRLDSQELTTITRFISQNAEGYWFWDEIGMEALGPFATLDDCREGLNLYVRWLNQEKP